MKKKFFYAVVISLLSTNLLQAQVTVGSDLPPHRTALLDIKTRQAAGKINTVGDDDNISATGGLLLPRVKLSSTNTLEPFVETTDPDWTDAEKQKKLRMSAVGLMVYNIETLGDGNSIYPAVYTWDGEKWSTSQANPSKMEITEQPKAFSFYETGEETLIPLKFGISGASGTITYQWYQLTGNNVHVRVGTKIGEPGAISGDGANTDSFTPKGIIKGITRNANNTGFYKFYCIATDGYGKTLISDIAEVAVGCGAKNNQGDWLTFMCFNLGATKLTMKEQKEYSITFSQPNDPRNNTHYYVTGEEKVYGDLYQWGRIGDGHQQRGDSAGFVNGRNTAGSNQINYKTNSNAADSIPNFESGAKIGTWTHPWNQVRRGTAHWGKFILVGSAQNGNWAARLPTSQLNQLWTNGRFTPNDPCAKIKEDGVTFETYYPVENGTASASTNWRMPTSDEWGSIFRGGGSPGTIGSATANTWVSNPHANNSTNIGYFEIKPDNETPTLLLPLSGYRACNNGVLSHQGSRGDYWSSTLIGEQGIALVIYNGSVNPVSRSNLGYGFAIRCIKSN